MAIASAPADLPANAQQVAMQYPARRPLPHVSAARTRAKSACDAVDPHVRHTTGELKLEQEQYCIAVPTAAVGQGRARNVDVVVGSIIECVCGPLRRKTEISRK